MIQSKTQYRAEVVGAPTKRFPGGFGMRIRPDFIPNNPVEIGKWVQENWKNLPGVYEGGIREVVKRHGPFFVDNSLIKAPDCLKLGPAAQLFWHDDSPVSCSIDGVCFDNVIDAGKNQPAEIFRDKIGLHAIHKVGFRAVPTMLGDTEELIKNFSEVLEALVSSGIYLDHENYFIPWALDFITGRCNNITVDDKSLVADGILLESWWLKKGLEPRKEEILFRRYEQFMRKFLFAPQDIVQQRELFMILFEVGREANSRSTVISSGSQDFETIVSINSTTFFPEDMERISFFSPVLHGLFLRPDQVLNLAQLFYLSGFAFQSMHTYSKQISQGNLPRHSLVAKAITSIFGTGYAVHDPFQFAVL